MTKSKLNFWERVRYRKNGLRVSTDGLLRKGQAELAITVPSADLLREAESFLRFVAKYLNETHAKITSGQTLNYGYWLVKFQPSGENGLEVWEYNSDGTEFVHGGALALRYWRDQHAICETYGANFDPPNPERLTVVSEGVTEGDVLEGIRYPSPEHMSGWWLLGPEYNGDVKTLKTIHTYHVTSARPDLVQYLALPSGFRFDIRKGERVCFDPEGANQPPV